MSPPFFWGGAKEAALKFYPCLMVTGASPLLLPLVKWNVSGGHKGSLDFYTLPLLAQYQRKTAKIEDFNKVQGLIT